MDLEGVKELEEEGKQHAAADLRIENPSAPSSQISATYLRHHQRSHPFPCSAESTTNQTGALVS